MTELLIAALVGFIVGGGLVYAVGWGGARHFQRAYQRGFESWQKTYDALDRANKEKDDLNKLVRMHQELFDISVLPMIVGAPEDPGVEVERIMCTSIAGGKNYLEGMPRDLVLCREFVDNTPNIYARYYMTEILPNMDSEPGGKTDE